MFLTNEPFSLGFPCQPHCKFSQARNGNWGPGLRAIKEASAVASVGSHLEPGMDHPEIKEPSSRSSAYNVYFGAHNHEKLGHRPVVAPIFAAVAASHGLLRDLLVLCMSSTHMPMPSTTHSCTCCLSGQVSGCCRFSPDFLPPSPAAFTTTDYSSSTH